MPLLHSGITFQRVKHSSKHLNESERNTNRHQAQTRHDFKSQAAGQLSECSETEADLQLILLHTVNMFGLIHKHDDAAPPWRSGDLPSRDLRLTSDLNLTSVTHADLRLTSSTLLFDTFFKKTTLNIFSHFARPVNLS